MTAYLRIFFTALLLLAGVQDVNASIPIQASSITVTPEISNDGSFTVEWIYNEPGSTENCLYFYIQIYGSGEVFETVDCTTTEVSVSGYEDGTYEISITTTYTYYDEDDNSYLDYYTSDSVYATVRLGVALDATFEEDLGNWSNTGSYTWRRDANGTSSSGTGPAEAPEGEYYLYMETSSGSAYNSGNTAILESEEVTIESAAISFQYHMYGEDIGTLYFEASNGSGWETLWSKSGQQHDSNSADWSTAHISESFDDSEVTKFRFRGVAAGGYRGDMAIDDIQIIYSEVESTETEFKYDALGRLSDVYKGGAVESHIEYDEVGNRIEVTNN